MPRSVRVPSVCCWRLGKLALQSAAMQPITSFIGPLEMKIKPSAGSRPAGRVVHCSKFGGPYPGSFVSMLIAAATAARSAGLETTVCLSRDRAAGQPWIADLSSCAEVRLFEPQGLQAKLLAVHEVLAESPIRTALHTHFGDYDEAAAIAGLLRRGTRVLWHLHSARNRPLKARSKAYGAAFGRCVDAVLCVSPEIRDTALAQWMPRAKVIDFPNAVDLSRFQPITDAERSVAREALELPVDAPVVLHFAWDWQIKGGDRLLAAAATLPGVTFLTVIGEDADPPALPANVRPLRPRADVAQLFAAADVFLNASRTEGMPFAVLEALARGLPVVAVDLPVSRAILEALPGARVVAPSVDALSGAISELAGLDRSAREQHAHAARARLEDSYSLNSWSSRLVGLYQRLLGAPAAGDR